MPKQFGQQKPTGFDPNRVKAPLAGEKEQMAIASGGAGVPGETPGINPNERLEGPQILWSGGGAMDQKGGAGVEGPPIMQQPTSEKPMLSPDKKRKKFDWKGAIQNGLESYDPNEEDAMNILSRMQGNESGYMNRQMY